MYILAAINQRLLTALLLSLFVHLSGCGDINNTFTANPDDLTDENSVTDKNDQNTTSDPTSAPNANNVLIPVGSEWKYFKGISYPGDTWTDTDYNDSTWLSGNTGIGYGDNDDNTILSDMPNNYITVYARKIFSLNDVSDISKLILNIDFDDGFIAYINGHEVARDNIAAGSVQYDTSATLTREAGNPIDFDLTNNISYLVKGNNVLAIEVHNKGLNSSDLSLIPLLKIETTSSKNNTSTNSSPTVNAGPDKVVTENETVQMSASASDSDGSITSYSWTQTSGPVVTLVNSNSSSSSFVAPAATQTINLSFKVVVVDNLGASAEDFINITVNPTTVTNTPPVSNAGLDITANEQVAVSLSGSGTDSDGTIVAYNWSQISGTPVALSSVNTAATSFFSPTTTSTLFLVFRLTVTDNNGASAASDVKVTVAPVNAAPQANAGSDITVNKLEKVTLVGSGADSDGSISSYYWSVVSGPSVSLSSPNTASLTFTAPDVTVMSQLVLRLMVTDNEGATATDDVMITITSNNIPVAISDSVTTSPNTSIKINVLANDKNISDTPLTLTVSSVPSNGIANVNTDNTITYTPNANYSGSDTFSYRVTDSNGDISVASVKILICNPCSTSRNILLQWDASLVSDNVFEYQVYFGKTDSTVDSAVLVTQVNSANFDSWLDLGLSIGDTACFKVVASNSHGSSEQSAPQCLVIQ